MSTARSSTIPLRLITIVAVYGVLVWASGLGTRDVFSSLIIALVACSLPFVHNSIVRVAERLANSWRAFTLGPVRIINYSVFAAAAALVGVLVFNLTFPDPTGFVSAWIAFCVLLGGGVWGKAIESTGKLTRPFGYFGASIGGAVGVVTVAFYTDEPLLRIGASLAIAAPWIQAIGRLRCLVQGCCHGRKLTFGRGIRYSSPNSRVVALSRLGGVMLHPTPLYSLYANVVSGIVLLRLFLHHQEGSLIAGTYLILAGISRFAEEGFRGEPQTKFIHGLSIYQWLSIVQLLSGAILTLFPSDIIAGPYDIAVTHVFWAVVTAIAFGIAMGVDFPNSNLPLARLTPRQ